ncbi:Co-chaperone protein DjlA [subsurface metagenome]
MENPFARISQRWMEALQEELQGWLNALMKDALDPAKMMKFLRGMGIDLSQLNQMFGQAAQTGTMPQGFDAYKILGLDKSASDEEVKQAYRKVMSRVHPDKAGPELTFMATMANAAYAMIKRERGWQ